MLPGGLTPHLQEQLAHLGTWLPFASAAAMLARFTQVQVSAATARRLTEVVGRAYAAVQQAEVERLCDELPPVPQGPEQAVVSVDGAMVPLRGGEWAEVKTLVVGEVLPPGAPPGQRQAGEGTAPPDGRTTALSYCSRLADVEQFNAAVLGELHRRGVETAGQVAAVSDGAEWIQGFVDLHCPHAVRILDFAHAAERVALIGQTLAPDDPNWLAPRLHGLKHSGPEPLLAELHQQIAAQTEPPPEVSEALAYLNKRVAQMQYPTFQAAGWPIGSGIVESANKLVVEARLKGAGMHWARPNVNPLLVLRTAVCNDRWDEAWTRSAASLRCHPLPRCPVPPPLVPTPAPPAPPPPPAAYPAGPPLPTKTHPWRNYGRKLSPKF
ncbi:MAG TPA: ISKra4 family transposase [Ktedonobacterales bacterium]|nr:ISKra4 family transposase [Ktedonobacterales bacterium]